MSILFMVLVLGWQGGQTETKPDENPDVKKISYILGYQYGDYIRKQKVEIDTDELLAGILDAAEGKPRYEAAEMQKAMRAFQSGLQKKHQADRVKSLEKNLKEGKAFLAENKAKPGVQTLESGLQYKVLTAGTGPKPKLDDSVTVHYRGSFLNGKEFDSSHRNNKPANFKVKQVIPGWIEALQKMEVGSKWMLYIPSDLAYGPQGYGQAIPGNAALVFEIELLGIGEETQTKTENQ